MGSNTINVVAGSIKVIVVQELGRFQPVPLHLLHPRDEMKKNYFFKQKLLFLKKTSKSFGGTCLEIHTTSTVQKKNETAPAGLSLNLSRGAGKKICATAQKGKFCDEKKMKAHLLDHL